MKEKKMIKFKNMPIWVLIAMLFVYVSTIVTIGYTIAVAAEPEGYNVIIFEEQ